MSKANDTYELSETYIYPNCVVRVHRPILTDEERAIRMKRIYDAAAELLKEVYKMK